MFFDYYLVSFIPLLFFALLLWSDVTRKSEYGVRSLYLLISLVVLGLGAVSVLLLNINLQAVKSNLVPFFFVLMGTTYLVSSFFLEFSIHCQRIEKSFLMADFMRSVPSLVILMVLNIIATAIVGYICSNAMTLDNSVYIFLFSQKEITVDKVFNFYLFLSLIAYLVVFISANMFFNAKLFNLQAGVIRQKKYLFNWLAVSYFVLFIILLSAKNNGSFNQELLSLLFIINICYILRYFEEYFFFRTNHFSLLLQQQETLQAQRNELIKSIMVSPLKDDPKIINKTLNTILEKAKSTLPVHEYRITGALIYRRKGNTLIIDNQEMVYGYCLPMEEMDNFKMMSKDAVLNIAMKHTFDLNQLELTDKPAKYGERALKEILKTKQSMIVPIPDCYKGLQRLIKFIPVIYQGNLEGLVVIYKDSFDKIFPEEDNALKMLIDYLVIIYSIMHGKELQSEQNRIQGEMEIAKQIQTSILPKSITIKGFDIASYMQTASEVGGDVYDFIPTSFGNYIGIGDVAGHGLPAGITSLIQLTAFESILFTADVLQKQVPIDTLYELVNKVMVNINNKRIGSDKFMTQNYLLENNGTFIHSGSHVVALVFRKSKDSIEELTEMTQRTGFLGISDLIKAKESVGSFKMGSGDILVLYTDGLIEAKDHYDNQFDLKRVKDFLVLNSQKTPEEIIQGLIQDLSHFAKDGDLKKHAGKFSDDVTILVFKKQ